MMASFSTTMPPNSVVEVQVHSNASTAKDPLGLYKVLILKLGGDTIEIRAEYEELTRLIDALEKLVDARREERDRRSVLG